MTERSRTLRSRSNFVASDAVEVPDQHAATGTPTKRNRNISNNSGSNKSDEQTSLRKRLTRASSEAKSSPIRRPSRRTRSNSMESEAVAQADVIEINNSRVADTSVKSRKRRSPLPSNTAIIEETALENSTTEESMFISKETFNSSHENTGKEGIEADVNAKEKHTTLTENPSAKTLQENETDKSINKDTLSDISEKDRSDATDTTTQMRSSILDVPKTPSRISTEVTARKLRLKNESLTNSSIIEEEEEDEHVSNKENRASNIIEVLQNKDISVSNVLSQSPQPLILSETCTGTSIKENDKDADSTDNMQNLIVTGTDSLNETTLNDSIDQNTSHLEMSKDSCLDESILECSQNVKNKSSLSPHHDDQDQSAMSVEIRDNSIQDGDIQIQKREENVNDTTTDKFLGFNKNEQTQHVGLEDETMTEDENIEMSLTLDVEETAYTDNSKCEVNEEVEMLDTSENLNDTDDMEYSKLSVMSIDEVSTPSKILTDKTTTNDLQDTEVAANVSSHENITKEPSDVHARPNNIKLANESNITDVIENSHSSVAQASAEPIEKALEEVDVTQTDVIENSHSSVTQASAEPNDKALEKVDVTQTDVIENSHPSNVAQASAEPIEKALEEVDETQTDVIENSHSSNIAQASAEPNNKAIEKVDVTQTDVIENSHPSNAAQASAEPIEKALEEVDVTQTDVIENSHPSNVAQASAEPIEKALEEVNVTQTDVIEDSHSSNVAQASAEPIEKALEEVDVTQTDVIENSHSSNIAQASATPNDKALEKVDVTQTDVIENSHSSNVAQASAEPNDKAIEEVDETQNTSKEDNCTVSEGKSIIVSNSQNDIEKTEVPETVQKQEEKMQVDDNRSDANIATDLFQDIPADQWKKINYDKNSVHSMSTERLENESETECDDFVLVVSQEAFQTVENMNKQNEKETFDYDSDDTVLLKAQKNPVKEKTVERLDMSESQCKTNENKSSVVKDTQQSMQQEEIKEAESVIKDAEIMSENQEERAKNQTEEIQKGENVSMRTSITNEVSKQSPHESDTSIEKPVDENLTNDIDQNLNILSTESSLNKRKSKNKLSEDVSNKRKSPCKSVEKSDGEVEESSEADAVEEKDSLNESPIGSPSNISDLSKTDDSMDSDIQREYNLLGVESKFSDDDVPGDECRASETESSDPDDNGSDLADFVVNDDDEISEEVESSEIDEESYSGQDDRHGEADKDALDRNEQRGKMQMQEESDEKARKKRKQKRIDMGTSKKEKSKLHKSAKLGLDKITESDKKITKSEIGTIDKKRKRNKIDYSDDDISGGNVKRLEKDRKLNKQKIVERQESDEEGVDKQYRKVQMNEDIMRNITKRRQQKRGLEGNKFTSTPKKEKTKLGKTTKIDLSEILESGKNIKRKCEIETNKIKKIQAEDNDNKMQKENAIPSWKKYENPTVKSIKMEVSRKRGRNLSEEVNESHPDVTMNKSKKRKLLNPEDLKLPSRSIFDSVLSAYGSTSNFYVTNIQKLKKRKNNVEVQLYRQRMLNRKARHLNYIMFMEKQKFSAKPF